MHEPSTYLNGLTIRDLEDLLADIRVYTELEQQQKSGEKSYHYDAQYWQDVTTITEDELAKLRKLSSRLYHDQRIDDRREGIHEAVSQDVTETFKNKTPLQLEQLEQRIRYGNLFYFSRSLYSMRIVSCFREVKECNMQRYKEAKENMYLRDDHVDKKTLKVSGVRFRSEDF
jgi:hypothetical protein